MDESTKKVAEALKKAILAEVEGQHFYRMAAASTQDEKGKEVFNALADDEVLHENYLRAHYDALIASGTAAPNVRLGTPPPLTESSPIFSAAIKSRIQGAHYEMTALSIGIQLEMGAMKFYEQAAKETSDPELSRFFRELSEWEGTHYRALLRQQDTLKEDYWSASGFTPF